MAGTRPSLPARTAVPRNRQRSFTKTVTNLRLSLSVIRPIIKNMFSITCHHCEKRYLVGTSAIVSFGNTAGGPEAVVSCPKGHAVLHDFRTDTSTPLPADDVLDVPVAA